MDEQTAEVGVVGAGFAGLAAALTLRRHRHSVLVFDGGPSRNAWAREVHGYLGIHGKSGAELRRLACDQVRDVGGQIVDARIAGARRAGDGFALAGEAGGEWRVGRLVLATGVRDAFPDIDNFFDFYGCSVHVCPHCDGYEVRDRPIAIVSWSEATLPFALKLTQWTTDVTVVTDGRSPELTPAERAELADHGIAVLTQTVRRFEGRDGHLTALRFADGSALPVEAAFFNIASEFQNDLARQLGCALTDAACVRVDDHMRTSVDGVWAVGDVTGEEQLVAIAAAQGVKAGVDIYRSLSPDG
jgi:thioredoxin reductase